jgi:hypothetical protein
MPVRAILLTEFNETQLLNLWVINDFRIRNQYQELIKLNIMKIKEKYAVAVALAVTKLILFEMIFKMTLFFHIRIHVMLEFPYNESIILNFMLLIMRVRFCVLLK